MDLDISHAVAAAVAGLLGGSVAWIAQTRSLRKVRQEITQMSEGGTSDTARDEIDRVARTLGGVPRNLTTIASVILAAGIALAVIGSMAGGGAKKELEEELAEAQGSINSIQKRLDEATSSLREEEKKYAEQEALFSELKGKMRSKSDEISDQKKELQGRLAIILAGNRELTKAIEWIESRGAYLKELASREEREIPVGELEEIQKLSTPPLVRMLRVPD